MYLDCGRNECIKRDWTERDWKSYFFKQSQLMTLYWENYNIDNDKWIIEWLLEIWCQNTVFSKGIEHLNF